MQNDQNKEPKVIHRNNSRFKFLHKNGAPELKPNLSGTMSTKTTFRLVREAKPGLAPQG